MKIIGITGGTGAGKTTALRVLEEMGALTIDCDRLYHDLLERSVSMLRELEDRFPTAFSQGMLQRKRLGRLVFDDPAALADLNRITHKYVAEEVDELLRRHREQGGTLAAVEAIALIEAGLGGRCDTVVGITAPLGIRAERIQAREGMTLSYALARIRGQKPEDYFRQSCDHVLENTFASPEAFAQACRALFTRLTSEE